MSGYPTSMSLSRVDGLSTDPRVLGRHSAKNWIDTKGVYENELPKCASAFVMYK